jgi:hypothetical protein
LYACLHAFPIFSNYFFAWRISMYYEPLPPYPPIDGRHSVIRSSAEAFGVKVPPPRPDHRNAAAKAHELLPSYGAAMRGPAERTARTLADVDRAAASQSAREIRGQALDHESVLALKVEISALKAALASVRTELAEVRDAQGSFTGDAA